MLNMFSQIQILVRLYKILNKFQVQKFSKNKQASRKFAKIFIRKPNKVFIKFSKDKTRSFRETQILIRISKFSREKFHKIFNKFWVQNFFKKQTSCQKICQDLYKKTQQAFQIKKPTRFFKNNLQVQNFRQKNNNNNNRFFLRKLPTHFGSKFFGNQQVSTTLTNFHHTLVNFLVAIFGVFLLH